MKESVVINIDRNLLSDAIKLAEKSNVNLSNYISILLNQTVKYEKGELDCLKAPPDGICLEALPEDADLDVTLHLLEIRMIKRALKLTNNIQSNAAKLLGVSRSNLNYKIQKYKSRIKKLDLDKYRTEIEGLLAAGQSNKNIANKYGIHVGQLLYWLSKSNLNY